MSTNLRTIHGTNGETLSGVSVTVFCGHSKLINTEGTRLCVQLTPPYGDDYSMLNMSAVKELIEQLQSVVDGTYKKFKD